MKQDPLHFAGRRFAIYKNGALVPDQAGVTYNHATGLLYRSQAYGKAPEHGVLDIQKALREKGRCTVGNLTAISHRLDQGPYHYLWQAEVAIGCVRIGTFD